MSFDVVYSLPHCLPFLTPLFLLYLQHILSTGDKKTTNVFRFTPFWIATVDKILWSISLFQSYFLFLKFCFLLVTTSKKFSLQYLQIIRAQYQRLNICRTNPDIDTKILALDDCKFLSNMIIRPIISHVGVSLYMLYYGAWSEGWSSLWSMGGLIYSVSVFKYLCSIFVIC